MATLLPEHVEGTLEEKAAIIRRFILNAPPGELPQVLRSLRTLTRADDFFFSIIPGLCNEYAMRQQTVFHYSGRPRAKHELARTSFALMATKHNHLSALVRRFAKGTGVSQRAASQEIVAYFEDAEMVPLEDDAVMASSATFEALQHVYVAVISVMNELHAVFVEIDPVEGHMIRAHCVSHSARLDASGFALLPPALQVVITAVLPQARSTPSAGDDEGPPGAGALFDRARLVCELQDVLDKHVRKAFCATSSIEVQPTRNPPSHPQGDGASTAAIAFPVSLPINEEDNAGAAATTVAITVSARHTNLRALWTGRWKAVFLATLKPPADGIAVGDWTLEMVGEARVHVHYFEDGNVHMESTRVIPKEEFTVTTKDTASGGGCSAGESVEAQIARKVGKQVRKAEQAFESELQEACKTGAGSKGDDAIKALRRRLPISRQLFDFSVESVAHNRSTFARPVKH